MGFIRKIKKKIGRAIQKVLPGTGRHARQRAEKAANEAMQSASAETVALQEEIKKEKRAANRLKIRALRSKRGAMYFQEGNMSDNQPQGRATIG